MRYFAVLALRRADWSEAIVSLNAKEESAQAVGQRVMAATPQKFIRCRTQRMELSPAQVRKVRHEWGRLDALEGEPLRRKIAFPKTYAAAYRAGYRLGKKLLGEGGTP